MCGLKDSDSRLFTQVGDLTMLQDMLGKEILPKYHNQVGWRIIDLFQNDRHCKLMLIVRWVSPQLLTVGTGSMVAVAAQEKISLTSGERRWDEISTTFCQQRFWMWCIISCPTYHQVERRRPWLMEQCGYKTNEALRLTDIVLYKFTQTSNRTQTLNKEFCLFANNFQAWSTKNQFWSIWDRRILSQTGDWLTMKNRHDLNTMILDEYWLQLNKKGFSLYRIYPILTSWQRVPCSYWSFARRTPEEISWVFIWLHRKKMSLVILVILVIFSQI